ncbi:unnamed protein product [Blepharisma stoltei]|uniref:C2H2-type domain-containing protein n=1 Tax=Blepharisma stoltei TaxID=1481888 RepID=A0AAU9IXM7_9CILI|nr:unnamed protein product [Blepharisma stoltei]
MENMTILEKPLPKTISLQIIHSDGFQNVFTYTCPRCSLEFATMFDLGLHSFGSYEYTCWRCFNQFPENLGTVKDNECLEEADDQSVHDLNDNGQVLTGQMTHYCDLCQKTFKSDKGFQQHMGKIHSSGYKNSKCNKCKCRFKNKYALKMHKKQVHEKSNRVICEICKKILYDKYHLRVHNEKEHAVELLPVD